MKWETPGHDEIGGRSEVWFWKHTVHDICLTSGRDLGWVQISVRHPVEPVNRLGEGRSRGQRAGFVPSGFHAFT